MPSTLNSFTGLSRCSVDLQVLLGNVVDDGNIAMLIWGRLALGAQLEALLLISVCFMCGCYPGLQVSVGLSHRLCLEQRGCSLLQQLSRPVGQGMSLLAQRLSLGSRWYAASCCAAKRHVTPSSKALPGSATLRCRRSDARSAARATTQGKRQGSSPHCQGAAGQPSCRYTIGGRETSSSYR